jgi:hypothetical protein
MQKEVKKNSATRSVAFTMYNFVCAKGSLKGQYHEIFYFKFFHESVSPKPLSIQLGPFEFFSRFVEIFAAQGAPPVSTLTPGAILQPVSLIPVANCHWCH